MQAPPPMAILRGHQTSITSLSFRNGQLFSGSRNLELFLWDLKSRRVLKVLNKGQEGTDDGILRVCNSEKGVFANTRVGRILVYSTDGELVHEENTGFPHGFAGCRLNGTDLLFADAFNGKTFVYDINSNSFFPVATCDNHGMIMDIGYFQDLFSIAFEDTTVATYDMRNTFEPVWTHSLKMSDPIISIAMANENSCIVGSSKKPIYEITPGSSKTFYEMPHPGIDDITIRGDGRIWATAGWDGRVRLFDAKKRIPLAVLKHHTGGLHSVAYADDGLLASGGDDRGIALWDLYRKPKK